MLNQLHFLALTLTLASLTVAPNHPEQVMAIMSLAPVDLEPDDYDLVPQHAELIDHWMKRNGTTLTTLQRDYGILNRGRTVAPDKINNLVLLKVEHLGQTTMDALGPAMESIAVESLIRTLTCKPAIIAYAQHLIPDPSDSPTYVGWQKGTDAKRWGRRRHLPQPARGRQACLDQHFVQRTADDDA